ncbi:hypothetical protein LCGC14_2889840, partial [marine sediment metagenome]
PIRMIIQMGETIGFSFTIKITQADFIIMECKQYINCKHWDSLCKNNLNAIKKCKKTVKLKGLSHFEPKK